MQINQKSQMMALLLIALLGIACIICASCDPAMDDRCGDDYVLNVDHCNPKVTESTTPPPSADSGMDGGNAAITDAGMPTGMGDPCADQADCEGFEASFCAMDPRVSEGNCTLENCSIGAADQCPREWKCCKMPPYISYPAFCIPELAWDEAHTSYGCEG